jgi:RHS repeat-associated protein
VSGANNAPQISSVPPTRGAVNQSYRYSVVATDPENDSLRYSLGRRPDGMTITNQGQILWTPTTAGAVDVEVQVTDSQGATTTQSYRIEVGTTLINQAPSITSTPRYEAPVGQAYTYQVVATDPENGSLTYQLLSGPVGMSLDATTGLLTWNTPVTGTYQVAVGALDAGGLGIAQSFTLTARVNGLPVIQSTPGLAATPTQQYRYDLIARDPEGGQLTYTLDANSLAKGISLDTLGRLRWTPTVAQVGNHTITLTVTDAAGASVEQQFTLQVNADIIAPVVKLIRSVDFADPGETVYFQARATDNIGVTNLQLFINDTPVILDGNGIAAYTPTTPGVISARAVAIDAAGNTSQATASISITDNTDTEAPVISLDLSSIPNGVIGAPTAIRGSVNDTNLDYYVLEIAPADGSSGFKEIFRGTGNVSNGVLGNFDPTLLQNDAYTLRLTAFDTNGRGTTTEREIAVTGDLKLGNFRLSFTDLSIPVTGIPITLTRTYDTLTSGYKDDFGYGWRMEFRDTDLRVSLPKDEVYDELGIRTVGFKEGTKVFITLPGGVREAFTFKPVVDPLSRFLAKAAAGAGIDADPNLYNAAFVSDKGVTSTLSIPGAEFRTSWVIRTEDGTFVTLGGQKYNPADLGGVYKLTTKDGTEYLIDANTGDLRTVTDPNGNTLTYTDSDITSSTGKKVTFTRDTAGRITTVTDPNGKQVKYVYDAQGDLVSVTDQVGNVTRMVYDTSYDDPLFPGTTDPGRTKRDHFLREIIDPLGRSGARMEYDEKGRLIRTLNATGNNVTFDYDPANSVQTIKDALGNPTTYEYDTRGNVVRQVDALGNQTQLKYDENNNLIEIRDPNNLVTRMTYDSRGNLLSRTEEYCGCVGVVPGTSFYTYDGRGNMTTLVTPTGATLNLEYDRRGNMLSMRDGKGSVIQSFTYNAWGQVTSETDISGTSRYTYDEFGNLTVSIDPDGIRTTMTYDANGKMTRMVEDNGTPNDTSDDESSTFTHDNLGRETRADYGNGIWVEFGYTGTTVEWTTLTAPTIGRIERKLTADGKLAGWTTPDGSTPGFTYDALGRLWQETDATGRVTTEYGYDAAGRVTSIKDVTTGAVTQRRYDAGGRMVEEIDPLGGFSRMVYNARNGKLDQTERGQYRRNADGSLFRDANNQLVIDSAVPIQITRFEYNGLQTTIIDPLGRRTTSVQDEYSLPTRTVFEQRNGRNYQTSAEYLYTNNLQEAKDYPTRIVDIGGHDRTFGYDSTGRLISSTDLGNNVTRFNYGENGLTTITGATGETLRYGYDDLGNLSEVIYGDGSRRTMSYRSTDNRLGTVTLASGETITYAYDDAGRVTTETVRSPGGIITDTLTYLYNAEGGLEQVTNATSSTTYELDPLTGRLSQMTNSNGSGIAYTYDLLGRTQTQTEWGSANGPRYTTAYNYDTFGNLLSVLDPAGGLTTMTYDVGNRLTSRSLPNGIITAYTYDDLDRVISITHTKGSTVLASVTYERNGIGEPSKITREDGSYVTLSYDASLRVTAENYHSPAGVLVETISYNYNAAGQRTSKVDRFGTDTYQYKPGYQLDAITGTGNEDYNYDADGRLNLISRNGTTLDLDHDTYNRIASINSSSGEQTTYLYDAQGNRIGEQTGSQQRRYLVTPIMGGGLNSQDLMTDGAGNLLSNFVYAGGTTPFMRLDASGNPVYYLTDALGSVIGLANGSGDEIADFRYDGFGNLRSSVGNAGDATLGGDFRFQGQWLESESGLYYFRARDYDAQTGLFLQRDPVDIIETEPESMNPYQFVYNNPYIYTDPTGMITLIELNANFSMQNALATTRTYAGNQVKDYLREKAGALVTDALWATIRSFIPAGNFQPQIVTQILNQVDNLARGGEFEDIFQGLICDLFGNALPQSWLQNLWLFPALSISNGNAIRPGFHCGPQNTSSPNYGTLPAAYAVPDYIISPEAPRSSKQGKPSWLVGDIKYSLKTLAEQYTPGGRYNKYNQFLAVARHARNHAARIAGFITLEGEKTNPEQYTAIILRESIKEGIASLILTIWDG